MAVTFATLTIDADSLVGVDPTQPVVATVRSNTDGAVLDADANKIFLGTASSKGTGTFTFSLPVTNGASNPTDFQYTVDLRYVYTKPDGTGERTTWNSGWFSFTASANLADIAAEQYVPPTWMSTAIDTLQGYVDQGEALLADQIDLSGISTSDGVVSALVLGTAGAGPLTRAALAAGYASLQQVATTVTASGAAVVGKHNPVNATSGAKALSLPTGQAEGRQISVEKTDATAFPVTITGHIRGVAAQTLTLAWQNETILLRTDSAGSWWPVAGHKTKTAIETAITTQAGNLVTPIQQLLKPATVMAVPATITVGNGGTASTISSGVTIAPTSAKLRYFGAYAGTTGAGWYSSREGYRLGQNIQYSMGPWGIEFDFDGDKFEVGGVVNTADIENIRFRVDGEFVTQAMTTNHPASGTGNNYIKVDLGSRKVRRIRVEFSAYFKFRHFIIPPTSTMWLPSTPFGPRVAAFGDSFTEGADGIAYFPQGPQTWTNTLGDYLGWKIRPMGVSGSGYINTGGAAKYRDRAVQDLTAPTQVGGTTPVYDYIIVSGGINDYASLAADFTAEIPLLYATIRSAQPTAKLIVVLPFNVRTIQQLTQAKVDAIRAAWVATGDVALIIETVYGTDGAWFFGTGQVGATTGDGNADFYRSTDGLHPSSSANYSGGHDYIASRIAAEIRKGLSV